MNHSIRYLNGYATFHQLALEIDSPSSWSIKQWESPSGTGIHSARRLVDEEGRDTTLSASTQREGGTERLTTRVFPLGRQFFCFSVGVCFFFNFKRKWTRCVQTKSLFEIVRPCTGSVQVRTVAPSSSSYGCVSPPPSTKSTNTENSKCSTQLDSPPPWSSIYWSDKYWYYGRERETAK